MILAENRGLAARWYFKPPAGPSLRFASPAQFLLVHHARIDDVDVDLYLVPAGRFLQAKKPGSESAARPLLDPPT